MSDEENIIESLREAGRVTRGKMEPEDRKDLISRLSAAANKIKALEGDREDGEEKLNELLERLELLEAVGKRWDELLEKILDVKRGVFTVEELYRHIDQWIEVPVT